MGVPAACSTLVGNSGQGRQLAAHRPPCLIAAAQPPACAVPLLLCSWNGCSNQDFALSTNGTLDVLQYLACEWLRCPPVGHLFLPPPNVCCSSSLFFSAPACLTLGGMSMVSSRGSGRGRNTRGLSACLAPACCACVTRCACCACRSLWGARGRLGARLAAGLCRGPLPAAGGLASLEAQALTPAEQQAAGQGCLPACLLSGHLACPSVTSLATFLTTPLPRLPRWPGRRPPTPSTTGGRRGTAPSRGSAPQRQMRRGWRTPSHTLALRATQTTTSSRR